MAARFFKRLEDWTDALSDRGLWKVFIGWAWCRDEHDWLDAGDWFMCRVCGDSQKLPNPK